MRKLFLLTVLIALAGCTLPSQSAPPPAATETAMPSAVVAPTDTLPAPTHTPSPPPTATLPASPAPTFTPLPPTATPEPLPTALSLPPLTAGQPVTITTIWMADAASGWGTGYQIQGEFHVLRTQDGGITWADASPPAGAYPLTDEPAVLFRDAQTAWVAYPAFPGQQGAVWRTSDGGLSWQGVSLPFDPDAEFFSPFAFVADGENAWLLVVVGAGMQHAYSDLYATQDGGQTWNLIANPFSEAAASLMGLPHTGMAFRGTTGWVTKENGVMDGVAFQATADGGITWTSTNPPPPMAAAMCSTYAPVLFTPQEGVFLTVCWDYQTDAQQAFFTSMTNGQVTYTPLPSVVDSLVFFTPQQGLALGCRDWGAPDPLQCDILATADGGQTWTVVKTVNWDGDFFFLDPLNGWAVARNGSQIALVRTDDGGHTWQLLQPIVSTP